MPVSKQLLILSDIHYASTEEQKRGSYELAIIKNPLQKLLVRCFRQLVWLRDPFAHNYLLDKLLEGSDEPDLVIANGDFSCDSGFVGVSDPAARLSAAEALGKLRRRYGTRLRATCGDHEFGKRSLAGNRGGMRLQSWRVATEELKLVPFWIDSVDNYLLMGVTSSLLAFPIYKSEALEEEHEEWWKLRKTHLAAIRSTFEQLPREKKVLLFCHDPTALPYLHDEPAVHARLSQIERTIIGHLHTPLVLWKSRLLAGMPTIGCLGTAIRRMSSALHEARKWRSFNLLLCPSIAGVQLTKRGGYYTCTLPEKAEGKAEFTFHHLRWR